MIGGFFIVLTPIVLVHELGHFWMARRFNIRVEEFGLGLPPRAVKLAERNGTIYSLNWIPLGGFVRPAGEDDPSVPGGLASASKTARFWVLVAGAGANFVMAVMVFWIAFMIGANTVDASKVVIAEVYVNSPAEEAGLQADDVILSVNDVVINGNVDLVQEQVGLAGETAVNMQIQRGDEKMTIQMTPRALNEGGNLMIGISLGNPMTGKRESLGPIAAAGKAVKQMADYVKLFFQVPVMLIRGEMSAKEARPVSIVGISQIAGQAAQTSAYTGNIYPLLMMIAFINVALGLTNLLPLPALDGGRIFFVFIEALRGRRVEPERESMVHVIGMLVLLGLMVFMIVQDIIHPIIPF